MEENTLRTRRIDLLLIAQVSDEVYKQLRGRIPLSLGFRRSEVHGLKQHFRPGEVTSLPMLRNEGARLAVSLAQPLRGHRVLQVELTFPP
jgi:hypothetical protein